MSLRFNINLEDDDEQWNGFFNTVKMIPYGQSWLIARLQQAKYLSENLPKGHGQCAGVAYSGRDMLLASDDFTKFNRRFFLMFSIPRERFSETIAAVQEKWLTVYAQSTKEDRLSLTKMRALKKKSLTQTEQDTLELPAFMERIVTFHEQVAFSKEFLFNQPSTLPGQAVCDMLASIALQKLGGAIKVGESLGMYTRADLETYFLLLEETFTEMAHSQRIRAESQGKVYKPNLPVIIIKSSDHAITLKYHVKSQRWILVDVNQLPAKFIEKANLTETVLKALDGVDNIAFSAKMYATSQNAKTARAFMHKCTQQEAWQQIQKIDTAKAKMIDGTGVGLLYLAARDNLLALVQQLLAQGADTNQVRNLYGQTPLYIAAKKGHMAVVEVLLQAGANPDDRCKENHTRQSQSQSSYK